MRKCVLVCLSVFVFTVSMSVSVCLVVSVSVGVCFGVSVSVGD